jgi:hypothetical protein
VALEAALSGDLIGDRLRDRSVQTLAHQLEIERVTERRVTGQELALSVVFLGFGVGVAIFAMDEGPKRTRSKKKGKKRGR